MAVLRQRCLVANLHTYRCIPPVRRLCPLRIRRTRLRALFARSNAHNDLLHRARSVHGVSRKRDSTGGLAIEEDSHARSEVYVNRMRVYPTYEFITRIFGIGNKKKICSIELYLLYINISPQSPYKSIKRQKLNGNYMFSDIF